MPGINKAIILGRLGKDPETKTFQNGGKTVSFSVATSETWTDKATGERKERTQWHRVVIFNEALASVAERFLKKGSEVYIEGQIEARKYTDRDGAEREITEIVLRSFRGEIALIGGRGAVEHDAPAAAAKPQAASAAKPPLSIHDDDDVPF